MRRRFALLALGLVALAGCGGGSSSGDSGSSGSSSKPDTKAISLPATLGSYKDVVDATKAKSPGGAAPAGLERRIASTTKLTTAAYTQAFGGAASAYRQYSDAGLLQLPSVIAVRSEAPGITYGSVADPKELSLRKTQNEVTKVGDVECLLFWEPIPLNQPVDTSKETASQCQRVGSGVTVFVYGSGFTGPDGVAAMAKLADDAFAAVG